jgi:hypothetical protein
MEMRERLSGVEGMETLLFDMASLPVSSSNNTTPNAYTSLFDVAIPSRPYLAADKEFEAH